MNQGFVLPEILLATHLALVVQERSTSVATEALLKLDKAQAGAQPAPI